MFRWSPHTRHVISVRNPPVGPVRMFKFRLYAGELKDISFYAVDGQSPRCASYSRQQSRRHFAIRMSEFFKVPNMKPRITSSPRFG